MSQLVRITSHTSSPSYLHPSTVFYLSILQPPCSTLFPYTTLFRSLVIDPGVAVGKAVYSELVHRARTGRLRWIEGRGDLEIVDRKSTRLNSSHVASSYAVFCLKKKKETRRTPLK